jgi:hypothetical protein
MIPARGKRKAFPSLSDHADKVYTDKKVYRDNIRFVEIFMKTNALLFHRPPQLGKTTLLSLADMLLNKTKTAPANLEYTPPDGVRNAWYVLRIDFGGIDSGGSEHAQGGWESSTVEYMDKGVNNQIQHCISTFLDRHVDIKTILLDNIRPKKVSDYSAGQLLSELAQSIIAAATDDQKPTLLVLVDEYDTPIREVLFGLMDSNNRADSKTPASRTTLQKTFHTYVNFFDNAKSLNSMEINIKTWVTRSARERERDCELEHFL